MGKSEGDGKRGKGIGLGSWGLGSFAWGYGSLGCGTWAFVSLELGAGFGSWVFGAKGSGLGAWGFGARAIEKANTRIERKNIMQIKFWIREHRPGGA